MKRPIVVLNIVLLLLFSLPAYAGPPLDAVQVNVNKVLEVLRDPKLKPRRPKRSKRKNFGLSMNACLMMSNFRSALWPRTGTA